jgi:hypothetical protein
MSKQPGYLHAIGYSAMHFLVTPKQALEPLGRIRLQAPELMTKQRPRHAPHASANDPVPELDFVNGLSLWIRMPMPAASQASKDRMIATS